MKYALISPNELVYDCNNDNALIGSRVAETASVTFDVAPPLFWVECSDDIVSDQYYYSSATNTLELTPVLPPPELPPEVTSNVSVSSNTSNVTVS